MQHLSQSDLRQLADQYLELSEALIDYRVAHDEELSLAERARLEELGRQLGNQSNFYTAQAIQVTLDDLDESLACIVRVTGKAKEAVERLQEVEQVIEMGACILSLAVALPTGNPQTIATAVQAAVSAVERL